MFSKCHMYIHQVGPLHFVNTGEVFGTLDVVETFICKI